jgi:hypothetical protein
MNLELLMIESLKLERTSLDCWRMEREEGADERRGGRLSTLDTRT